MTAWNATFLMIWILAAYCAASVYCSAPDWIQKLVLGLWIVGALVLVVHYALSFYGGGSIWYVRMIGLTVLSIGVLLSIFRVFFIEKLQCKSLSAGYQQSRD